jgi:hypothetical protein
MLSIEFLHECQKLAICLIPKEKPSFRLRHQIGRLGGNMAKIIAVLYPDPVGGYPTSHARDSVPLITSHPGGQTTPTPKTIDFTPGELLGIFSPARSA